MDQKIEWHRMGNLVLDQNIYGNLAYIKDGILSQAGNTINFLFKE